MMDYRSMRSIAVMLAMSLVVQGPPLESETNDESEVDTGAEEAADDLEQLADDLADKGHYYEAVGLYEQAYELVPDRHGLAYKIGLTSYMHHYCGTAEEYLTHFVDNGQLLLYAKELEHAREILYKI